jgi:hypothetical protein
MATSGQITVRIEGLEELRDKLQSSRADVPVQRFLDRAASHLQGGARKKAPIDTGRLRNSIGIESPNASTRRIGPSVEYGPSIEFGTRPHMPPVSELVGWSRKRGLDPYAVAEGISIAGTKAQPFLQPAADETEVLIRTTLVSVLAAEIESAFQ